MRNEKLGVQGQGARGKGLEVKKLLFLSFLFTVHCFLFTVFYGCASKKPPHLPKVEADALSYNQRGVDAIEEGKYENALHELSRSLALHERIDHQKGVAINLLNLGRLYLLIERFDDAHKALERARQIGLSTNDQFILSEAYGSLGRYHYLIGNANDAIEMLEKGVIIDKKEGYRTIGSKLNIKGMAYGDSGRLDEAEKILNEALEANKGYGMEFDTADSLRGLGDIYFKKGEYRKARELYENALTIDKKTGKGSRISLDLFSLGILSLTENDAQTALDFFLRAYAVDRSRGDNKSSLRNLDKIITIYGALGDKKHIDMYSLERERLLQLFPKKEVDKK